MPEREIPLQGRPAPVLRFPRLPQRPPGPAAGAVPQAPRQAVLPAYVELHCISNFSFLRGAAHPEELVEQALRLGYDGMALTDECSVAGVVRMWDGLRQIRKDHDEAWRTAYRIFII